MACNSGIPEYEGESEQVREVTFRVSQMGGRLARAMATNFEVGDSIGIYAVKRDIRTAPDNTDLHNMLAWQPGVKAIAVKCDLCYFREDGPACVQTCPTKTLFIISDESIKQANERKREMAMVSSPAIPR